MNSLQRWLLRLSSSFRDVSSLRSLALPTPPSHFRSAHLPPSESPLAPSVSFSRRASRASYSLSFVIRKQTGRRSCQVGGVGDETAVSVCPFFFHRLHPPSHLVSSIQHPARSLSFDHLTRRRESSSLHRKKHSQQKSHRVRLLVSPSVVILLARLKYSQRKIILFVCNLDSIDGRFIIFFVILA